MLCGDSPKGYGLDSFVDSVSNGKTLIGPTAMLPADFTNQNNIARRHKLPSVVAAAQVNQYAVR